MNKPTVWLLVILLVLPGLVSAQEKGDLEGKDDMEALGTVARIAAFPLDLVLSPLMNLWAEAWSLPARGADLLEYQDKYYNDYDTGALRETDARRWPGHRPMDEYAAPPLRPRKAASILYVPPKR